MSKYPFEAIEPKWQKFWDEHNTFKAVEDEKFPRKSECMFLICSHILVLQVFM